MKKMGVKGYNGAKMSVRWLRNCKIKERKYV